MEFPKKPNVIDSIQWNGNNLPEVLAFMDWNKKTSRISFLTEKPGKFRKINSGDWIIKNAIGEFDVWIQNKHNEGTSQ